MIACLDVAYRTDAAVAACLLFLDWRDAAGVAELVTRTAAPAAYVPGQFFRRELPCLLHVLGRVKHPLHAILIDGYVWLDGEGKLGLGGHLYDALNRAVPVIGVAKNRFRTGSPCREVLRGRSRRPLYVSAAGIDLNAAAGHVQAMEGPFRIPTLLQAVDRLCRET